MTLDDLEHLSKGFNRLFGDFWLQDTVQEPIVLKSIEIDKDKLHMKFLALNVDFDRVRRHLIGDTSSDDNCSSRRQIACNFITRHFIDGRAVGHASSTVINRN